MPKTRGRMYLETMKDSKAERSQKNAGLQKVQARGRKGKSKKKVKRRQPEKLCGEGSGMRENMK